MLVRTKGVPLRIAIAEAKTRFAELIRRAEAGEAIELTRQGRPVAARSQHCRRLRKSAGIRRFAALLPGSFLSLSYGSCCCRRPVSRRLSRERGRGTDPTVRVRDTFG
ncbi:MAG: type II toxin-antitoxin system prevent-host-death family antitoxin [Boseongicola sp.]|nr:type II toxin-antitoxin system prevent-host-death family antitoxin [Boseongicola sp.]